MIPVLQINDNRNIIWTSYLNYDTSDTHKEIYNSYKNQSAQDFQLTTYVSYRNIIKYASICFCICITYEVLLKLYYGENCDMRKYKYHRCGYYSY